MCRSEIPAFIKKKWTLRFRGQNNAVFTPRGENCVILPAKTKCSLLFYKRRNFWTAHFLAIKMTDSWDNLTDWEALELENTPAEMIIDYGQLHPDWTTFLDRCRVSQHIFSINRLRVSHSVSCHHRSFRLSYRCWEYRHSSLSSSRPFGHLESRRITSLS